MRKSILMLVMILMPALSYAGNRFVALSDAITAASNDTGRITIRMENEVPVNGLNVVVQFDPKLITVIDILPMGRAKAVNGVGAHRYNHDKIGLIWFRPNAKQIPTGEGRIFEIQYLVSDSLVADNATTPVTFFQGIAADSNLAVIPFDYLDGAITIINPRTDVTNQPELPTEYALLQNYPNPFNPATTIKYALPAMSQISVQIFNILGQRVTTLVDGIQPPGYHAIVWDATGANGRQVATGTYFFRLQASRPGSNRPSFVDIKKMSLLK